MSLVVGFTGSRTGFHSVPLIKSVVGSVQKAGHSVAAGFQLVALVSGLGLIPGGLAWLRLSQPLEAGARLKVEYRKEQARMKHYFIDCASVEEVKRRFKQLALKHHPDLGGDQGTMKEINRQYQAALKQGDGQSYKGEDNKEHIYKYHDELEEELATKMMELIALKLESVEIYLIGLWIWVVGDCKQSKEKLKGLGCWWNPKRKCWYYKPKGFNSRGSKGSLEDLAKKYGIENVHNFKKYEDRKPIKHGLVKI
jgi:hypothetical protein